MLKTHSVILLIFILVLSAPITFSRLIHHSVNPTNHERELSQTELNSVYALLSEH
ncbi:hypothetical protein VVNSV5830_00589 [Vibrio vulnificus]|nr:hypothetical protein VVORL1506_01288 [Vibrio vulnificus]OJI29311.1 hypothetical protein VVNSV5830_00589 [Vibrio vulnificus]